MFDGARYAIVLGDARLEESDLLDPLRGHPLLDAVAVAPSPDRLFGFVGRHGPAALAVIDLRERPEVALDVAQRLRRTWPATGLLAVGRGAHDPDLRAALRANGARVHGCPGPDWDGVAAISTTLARPASRIGGPHDPDDDESGEPTVSPTELGLSARQAQVLWFVLHGASNKRIAQRLALSEATVKEHVSAVLRRLAVASRTEAMARLRGRRLVVPALCDPLPRGAGSSAIRSRSTPSPA